MLNQSGLEEVEKISEEKDSISSDEPKEVSTSSQDYFSDMSQESLGSHKQGNSCLVTSKNDTDFK